MQWRLVIVLLANLILACGKNEGQQSTQGKDPTLATEPSTTPELALFKRLGLQGNWQSACYVPDSGSDTYRISLQFYGNQIRQSYTWFEGSACVNSRALARWDEFHAEAAEKTSSDSDWTTVTFVTQSINLTPLSERGASILNHDRAYDRGNWAMLSPRDVSQQRYNSRSQTELTIGNSYRRAYAMDGTFLRQGTYENAKVTWLALPQRLFYRSQEETSEN